MYGAMMRRLLRDPSWSALLPLVCGCAIVVVASCVVPADIERYWLAFAGDWTLAHGRILETLQGSWYPQRPWVDQEWLVAVATAWTRAHHLYLALELLYAACIIAGVVFVARESVATKTHPLIACAQVAVTAMGAVFFAQDRAQTLVWALLPALIVLWRSRPWAAVPLLALWANVHGSFPIAVVWMLLHLDRRRVAPFAVATLATLANPLGWHLWYFTVALARNARLAEYVNEWSPALSNRAGIGVALIALAPLWLRLAAGPRLARPVRIGDFLFVAASAVGTAIAIRYSMLLFLTTATALGDAFATSARPLPFATRAASALFTVAILVFGWRSFSGTAIAYDPAFGNLARSENFSACAPLVAGKRVFTDAFEVGSPIELAGGVANLDGRIDAFPLDAIRDAATVLRHPQRASPIVRRSGAQMLALTGHYAPGNPWHAVATCGDVRLYAR